MKSVPPLVHIKYGLTVLHSHLRKAFSEISVKVLIILVSAHCVGHYCGIVYILQLQSLH